MAEFLNRTIQKEDATPAPQELGVFQPPIRPAVAITPVEYGALQRAFDHFNVELFEGRLPDVMITYQRRARSAGHFSANRFANRIDARFDEHELALNPDVFVGQTDKQICQTLAHEMCHLWQHAFGTPSRGGYHNREWAAKMKTIGLQPSSTGEADGKDTRPRMLDYVIPGGSFERAFEELAANGWRVSLESVPRKGDGTGAETEFADPRGAKNNSKTRFTCPGCGANAWGKPDLMLGCIPCRMQMAAEY